MRNNVLAQPGSTPWKTESVGKERAMKVRAGSFERLAWLLIIAGAALFPSCGGSHNSGGSSSSIPSSTNASVSGDGNLVAFDSTSTGLVAGGSPSTGLSEIFVFDRGAGATRQITQGASGSSNGESSNPVLSQDGQWVAFESLATNLAGMTTSGTTSATTTGTMTTTSGPTQGNQILVASLATGQMRLVSVASTGGFSVGNSLNPSITSGGQFVAFDSNAVDMTAGLSTSASGTFRNVFVWTMATNLVQLVSVTLDNSPANGDSTNPSISADGRFVAFESVAGNFGSTATTPMGKMRIFVRDTLLNTTLAVTPDLDGVPINGDSSNPSISGDGRFVAFESTASNLIGGSSTNVNTGRSNVFVWDRLSGMIQEITVTAGSSSSASNGDSHNPSISVDGHFVAFDSSSTNLVTGSTGGTNVFVRDLQLGTTTMIGGPPGSSTTSGTTTTSTTTSGTMPTTNAEASTGDASTNPSISQDGIWVAFTSDTPGLTPEPTSGGPNVFLANRVTGTIILVSNVIATGTTTTGTTTSGTTTTGTTTTGSTTGTTAGTTTGTTTGTTMATTSTSATATTSATGTTGGMTGTTLATTSTTFTTFGTTGSSFGTTGTSLGTTGTTFSTFATSGSSFGTTGTSLGTSTTFSTFGTTGTTFGTTGTTFGTTSTTQTAGTTGTTAGSTFGTTAGTTLGGTGATAATFGTTTPFGTTGTTLGTTGGTTGSTTP